MTIENPYSAPDADVQSGPSGSLRHYGDAGNGLRFANLVFDYIGFILLSVVIGAVLGLLGQERLVTSELANRVLGFVVMLLYYVGLEATTGRTLGKLITGTRVISTRGGDATFLQIVGRSFARFVPFEPFSFFLSDPGGWHDVWSNTRVVRLRPSKIQRLADKDG